MSSSKRFTVIDNPNSTFTFVDLFSGIGGFHAALRKYDGKCVFASEIDKQASEVYEHNWNQSTFGDINNYTDSENMLVPEHDILCAGFPCQPFSKSGFQKGMLDETRGTLFFNIEQILSVRKPAVILLENVRNLAGPRHTDEWNTIIRHLREQGYRVSSTPSIFSPHLLPPKKGGRPQVRERVFIAGTYVGRERAVRETDISPLTLPKPQYDWNPMQWNLFDYLDDIVDSKYDLSDIEKSWLSAWSDFIHQYWQDKNLQLPSFPLWYDDWLPLETIIDKYGGNESFEALPAWKKNILKKNSDFYSNNMELIKKWKKQHDEVDSFPPSRRKLEWQAQDTRTLDDTILHFRPSGIRIKKATYAPALVAITQTTVLGGKKRRLTPREAARLQAFPEWFDFSIQPDAATYKQLGNAVNINVVYWILHQHVQKDKVDIEIIAPHIVKTILSKSENGDCVEGIK